MEWNKNWVFLIGLPFSVSVQIRLYGYWLKWASVTSAEWSVSTVNWAVLLLDRQEHCRLVDVSISGGRGRKPILYDGLSYLSLFGSVKLDWVYDLPNFFQVCQSFWRFWENVRVFRTNQFGFQVLQELSQAALQRNLLWWPNSFVKLKIIQFYNISRIGDHLKWSKRQQQIELENQANIKRIFKPCKDVGRSW